MLIWGFAGRTYHIVGNLIDWLIYEYGVISDSFVKYSNADKWQINDANRLETI